MKKLLIGLCLLVLIVIITFAVLSYLSRSAQPLGLQNGKLHPCPDSPNCVYSEDFAQDPAPTSEYYIAPLEYSVSDQLMLDHIKLAIADLGGKTIQIQAHYLAATFSSAIFHFQDDLELRLSNENKLKLVHFRSASRVGRSDFGVNRKRVVKLKALLERRLKGQ